MYIPSEVTAFPAGAGYIAGLVVLAFVCAATPLGALLVAVPWTLRAVGNQKRAMIQLVVTANHVEWTVNNRPRRLLLHEITDIELLPVGTRRVGGAGIEHGFELILHTQDEEHALPMLYVRTTPAVDGITLDVLVELRAFIGELAARPSEPADLPAALAQLRAKRAQ